MTFLHPVCHSREGGNPEDLQSKVLPQLIEKLLLLYQAMSVQRFPVQV